VRVLPLARKWHESNDVVAAGADSVVALLVDVLAIDAQRATSEIADCGDHVLQAAHVDVHGFVPDDGLELAVNRWQVLLNVTATAAPSVVTTRQRDEDAHVVVVARPTLELVSKQDVLFVARSEDQPHGRGGPRSERGLHHGAKGRDARASGDEDRRRRIVGGPGEDPKRTHGAQTCTVAKRVQRFGDRPTRDAGDCELEARAPIWGRSDRVGALFGRLPYRDKQVEPLAGRVGHVLLVDPLEHELTNRGGQVAVRNEIDVEILGGGHGGAAYTVGPAALTPKRAHASFATKQILSACHLQLEPHLVDPLGVLPSVAARARASTSLGFIACAMLLASVRCDGESPPSDSPPAPSTHAWGRGQAPDPAGSNGLAVPGPPTPAALSEILAHVPKAEQDSTGPDGASLVGSKTERPEDDSIPEELVINPEPQAVVKLGVAKKQPSLSSAGIERALRAGLYHELVQRCRASDGSILPPEAIKLHFTLAADRTIAPSTIVSTAMSPEHRDAASCMRRALGAVSFRAPSSARGQTTEVTALVPSVD